MHAALELIMHMYIYDNSHRSRLAIHLANFIFAIYFSLAN